MTTPLLHVPHARPLLEATLLGRYQRFIAEARLQDGRVILAHCINPGQMEGMVRSGSRIWVSTVPPEAKRKLRYTWELSEIEGERIGANTQIPNRIAEALVLARSLHGFRRFDRLRREVPYGEHSRVDLCLDGRAGRHLVEVKNCHLVYPDDRGYFPDSTSVRASGHLRELIATVRGGDRASVLFTVQVARAKALRPSDVHDPTFAALAREARAAGVRFAAVRIDVTPEGYDVLERIPVDLARYDTRRVMAWREANRPHSGWKRERPSGWKAG
ncbi:MAG: DNA/RNA nuclease SfsA [Deltaproteobacteria bacterium]|nr:DNA/RNA nuclease SfsA [Deltaproteobacteria bacterium]